MNGTKIELVRTYGQAHYTDKQHKSKSQLNKLNFSLTNSKSYQLMTCSLLKSWGKIPAFYGSTED